MDPITYAMAIALQAAQGAQTEPAGVPTSWVGITGAVMLAVVGLLAKLVLKQADGFVLINATLVKDQEVRAADRAAESRARTEDSKAITAAMVATAERMTTLERSIAERMTRLEERNDDD